MNLKNGVKLYTLITLGHSSYGFRAPALPPHVLLIEWQPYKATTYNPQINHYQITCQKQLQDPLLYH